MPAASRFDVGLPRWPHREVTFTCEITMWAILVAVLVGEQSFRIPVAPGETLAVTAAGAGDPIVLIPALLGAGYGYRRLTPLLNQAGFRSIVIEPLGVGGSSRPRAADYSLSAQASRVAAALDSLQVRRAYILGHAVGSAIALRLAYRRPDLVLGMISLEGGATETAGTPGLRRALTFAPLIKLLGVGFILRKIRAQFVAASGDPSWVSDAVVAGYTAHAARDFSAVIDGYRAMARAREPEPLTPRLGEIRCPVYLLLGAVPHDGAPGSAEVALLANQIPMFSADTLPHVGHFPHEEAPAAVADAANRVRATATHLAARR